MIVFSSPISPLAFGTDSAIVVMPGRSQPQWFRASIPSAPLSPAFALPKSEVPRMSGYSGLGLAQFFGKTQPQCYVVDGLAGPRIHHERGDLFVRPTHASQDRHYAPLLFGRFKRWLARSRARPTTAGISRLP